MNNRSMKYLISLIVATLILLLIALNAHASPVTPQHWINVTAVACQGPSNVEVRYTATSWATGDDGSNDNVQFAYQTESNSNVVSAYNVVTADDGSNFHFGQDNNYTISGSLLVPSDTVRISLVFTVLVNWNSGFPGGQVAYYDVATQQCDSTTGESEVGETSRIFLASLYR